MKIYALYTNDEWADAIRDIEPIEMSNDAVKRALAKDMKTYIGINVFHPENLIVFSPDASTRGVCIPDVQEA